MKNLVPSLYVLETTDFNISNDILDMLPTERQIRINKAIKIEKAKQLYASSLLLGYILDKYGKKFDDIKLLESGKPYIKDGPYFNVSHSGKYVVIAVDLEDIGVDIQEKTTVSEAAAKMFLGDDSDLNMALRNEYYHSYIWCRKEAFLKCLGVGWNGKRESDVSILCNKIEYNASSYFLTDYFVSEDYFLTLCEKNEHKDFAIEEVSKLELEIFYRSG